MYLIKKAKHVGVGPPMKIFNSRGGERQNDFSYMQMKEKLEKKYFVDNPTRIND